MNLLFALITAQVVMGAFDELWHHEIKERLPAKRAAARETALHAAREFLYALIFFALAWYEWRGAWALLLAAVIIAEIPITLLDFIEEDRSRRPPPLERVLHTVLAINLGLVLAVLAPITLAWWRAPTGVVSVDHGVFSWLLTLFAVGVFAWSVRNALAVLRHRRPPEWVRDPIVAGERTAASRTVLISGATGFVGGHLVRRLVARGDTVLVYARDADRALDRFGPHVHVVTNLDVIEPSARIDAIVNLAGARILGLPWTRGRRRTLIASRLQTTRALVALCARLERPPRVFVSASAIGYYGTRGEQRLDEQSPPQPIFQSVLCQQWEEAAVAAEAIGARVVRLRFGLVLGRDGGALPSLALPVRLGLGAVLGSGKQWVSWNSYRRSHAPHRARARQAVGARRDERRRPKPRDTPAGSAHTRAHAAPTDMDARARVRRARRNGRDGATPRRWAARRAASRAHMRLRVPPSRSACGVGSPHRRARQGGRRRAHRDVLQRRVPGL